MQCEDGQIAGIVFLLSQVEDHDRVADENLKEKSQN